eukprot:jgi/Undpi1/3324/HiC_scaffold_15.g06697.m1
MWEEQLSASETREFVAAATTGRDQQQQEQQQNQEELVIGGGGEALPRSTGGGGDANAGEDGARTGGDGGGAAAATAEAQHLALELNRSIDGSQEQPSFVEPGRRSAGSEESDCDRPTSLTELGVSSSAAQERYSNDNMDQLQRFGEQQYARVGTDGVVCTPGGGGAVGEEGEEGEDEGGGGDDSAVGYPQEEDDAPCCDGPAREFVGVTRRIGMGSEGTLVSALAPRGPGEIGYLAVVVIVVLTAAADFVELGRLRLDETHGDGGKCPSSSHPRFVELRRRDWIPGGGGGSDGAVADVEVA